MRILVNIHKHVHNFARNSWCKTFGCFCLFYALLFMRPDNRNTLFSLISRAHKRKNSWDDDGVRTPKLLYLYLPITNGRTWNDNNNRTGGAHTNYSNMGFRYVNRMILIMPWILKKERSFSARLFSSRVHAAGTNVRFTSVLFHARMHCTRLVSTILI